METWLTCTNTPISDWGKILLTYLDPPAFTTIQALKTSQEKEGTWHNSYEEIKTALLKHFGDIDPNFSTRNKLAQLKLTNHYNIINYTKTFNELCTKIVDEPLSDQAKIAAYLTGIQDPALYQNLIIEPSTGTRWTEFHKLYDFVLNKYSILSNLPTPPAHRPLRVFNNRQNPGRRSWNTTTKPAQNQSSHLTCALSRSTQPYQSHNNRFHNPNRRPLGHFNAYRPPPRHFPPHSPPLRRPFSNSGNYQQRPRPPFQSRPFTNKRPFRAQGPPNKRLRNFHNNPQPSHFATLSARPIHQSPKSRNKNSRSKGQYKPTFPEPVL